MSDEGSAFWFGVALTILVGVIVWHTAEAACQKKHNVYDCVWTQSPFTPVIPEEGRE